MTEHENGKPKPEATPSQSSKAYGLTEADRVKLNDLCGVLRGIADARVVSPWLARRAIDAVDLVLACAKLHSQCRNRSGRNLDELSDEEVERLRLINRKLTEAEGWIRKRRDQARADYYRAGGVGGNGKKYCYSENLWEGVELEVEVVCVLREDHPDFDEDDDNIVCELRWLDFDGVVGNPAAHNWNRFAPGHRLSGERHCRLLHDLYDRAGLSWDDILAIGGLWLDVSLIQQRGERF